MYLCALLYVSPLSVLEEAHLLSQQVVKKASPRCLPLTDLLHLHLELQVDLFSQVVQPHISLVGPGDREKKSSIIYSSKLHCIIIRCTKKNASKVA